MVSQDPYSEADTREFDPALGPIKINSTVFSHEFIMVQKYHESALVPLWVSTYRRPFQHTSFRQSLYQDVRYILFYYSSTSCYYIMPICWINLL